MIVEVTGRIFHMHIHAETEDGPADITADVALEPSMGLLMISAGAIAVSGSWPHRGQWGTNTFEEFLCSRTPAWIAEKLLGDDGSIFDPDKTKEVLLDACGNESVPDIFNLMEHIDSHGAIRTTGEALADSLEECLEEPIDSYIMMQPTGFAEFLVDAVIPSLLDRLAPPPVITNQTNLKLC